MKKLYTLFIAAMCTTFGFAQSVTIVTDSHKPTDLISNTSPASIIANSSMILYKGTGVNYWKTTPTSTIQLFDNEVWVSDGTSANTRMLEVNNTTTVSSGVTTYGSGSFANPIVLNDNIYFNANNGKGAYVYSINGLAGDTVRKGSWSMNSPQFVMDGKIITRTGTSKPWVSWDGVNKPDTLPNQLFSGATIVSVISHAIGLNGKILFAGNLTNDNPNVGTELIMYDPAVATGPYLVKDLNSSAVGANGSPKYFTLAGNEVYFVATNSSAKNTLWVTDGTAAGTVEVAAASALTFATSAELFVFNNKLYFDASDGTNLTQLYEYDLTAKTLARLTSLVKADGTGAAVSFSPKEYTVLNGTLYLVGNYTFMSDAITPVSTYANALFKLNGSTVEVIEASKKCDYFTDLTVFKDKICFAASQAKFIDNGDGTFTSSGTELFMFDTAGITETVPYVNKNTIKVVSNPFGELHIYGIESSNSIYEIMDIKGVSLSKGKLLNNTIRYNAENGIYILKIANMNNIYSAKFVINN